MGRGKVHPSVSGMMTGRWTRAAETFACRPGSPVLTDAAPPQVRVPLPAPSGYGWPERLPPERPRLYPAAFPCSCTHLLPPGTAQERTLLHMTPCPGSPAHPSDAGNHIPQMAHQTVVPQGVRRQLYAHFLFYAADTVLYQPGHIHGMGHVLLR